MINERLKMKKYSTLLFDLDDTILDFTNGEQVALTKLFEEMNINDVQMVINDYVVLNKSLWNNLEKGLLERDYLLNHRFSMLFKKYNIEVDGEEIEKKYRNYLDMQHDCIDGAKELLNNLFKEYKIYLITNGVSKTQLKRIKDANLEHYFTEVFVSENIGYQKPAIEYFNAISKKIRDFELGKSLIIGDSLTADITGGISAGIDTCWFNPRHIENLTEIKPTYEINKLNELYKILK